MAEKNSEGNLMGEVRRPRLSAESEEMEANGK